MIRPLVAIGLLASSLGTVSARAAPGDAGAPTSKRDLYRTGDAGPWVAGEVLVQFKPGMRRTASGAIHAARGRGARVLGRIGGLGGPIERVALPAGVSVEDAVAAYEADPAVLMAEPNLVREYAGHVTLPPVGDWYDQQWGLHNTGQSHQRTGGGSSSGKPGADIDAPEAWAVESGESDPTVVAVADSGVDVTHPDIQPSLWTNLGEDGGTPGDDDDGNGYVDDLNGCNFASENCTSLTDGVEHGTHVAGTIAGANQAPDGVIGVCPHCQIMVLKLGSTITLASELAAFEYAWKNGAHVVNGSFGGPVWSKLEYRAIRKLGRKGILTVFAAGNDALDNDLGFPGSNPSFPASYLLDNIISVAASNHRDHYGYQTRCDARNPRRYCAFSSFGRESVDLAAPGVDVVSSVPGGSHAFYDGTSMATPHVAGIAGLVRAADPTLTPVEIKNKIMNGADRNLSSMRHVWSLMFPGGKAAGRFSRTSGRANAAGALAAGTNNATRITDGNVDGARWFGRRRHGRVSYPKDVNDVFFKRLQKGRRYRAVLRVPKRKDYDLWVWLPRIKQIWQFEIGCLRRGRCPLVDSGIEGTGKNEVLTFRAPRTGRYYFHVSAWVKERGRYRLVVRRA